MPTFQYIAKSASGETVKGAIEAVSRKLALQRLASQSLSPISVAEEGDLQAADSSGEFSIKDIFAKIQSANTSNKPLGRSLALPFLHSLAELLRCGIQAGDAVSMLSSRLSNARQKQLAAAVWDSLRQGKSLSEAFSEQPTVFEESLVNLVEAGEATGNLSNVLDRIVESMEERREIKAKLTSALAYPIFLIAVCLAVGFFFLFKLLPMIQDLLTSLGSKLPLATRMLIGLSHFTLSYGWILGLVLVLGIFGIVSWRQTQKGRLAFDGFILRIPFLGRFLRDGQILRLTQTLSLLLENGITMVMSLRMTERAINNLAMRERFAEANGKVVEGASLSSAFKSTGYFDDMVLDIFTVGENTGNIVPGLKQMSRQYSDFINRFIKTALGVLSVGVLLLAFSFVALIALGIITSVLQLSSGLSAG